MVVCFGIMGLAWFLVSGVLFSLRGVVFCSCCEFFFVGCFCFGWGFTLGVGVGCGYVGV